MNSLKVPCRKDGSMGQSKYFEEIMAEHFPTSWPAPGLLLLATPSLDPGSHVCCVFHHLLKYIGPFYIKRVV